MNEHQGWRKVLENARHYLAVGQREVYLHDRDGDYPWHLATRISAGGMHRSGIPIDVTFYADTDAGLVLRWSFDLEPREANGSGIFQIDMPAIWGVLGKVAPKVASDFRTHLASLAGTIWKRADELKAAADGQYALATSLSSLGL